MSVVGGGWLVVVGNRRSPARWRHRGVGEECGGSGSGGSGRVVSLACAVVVVAVGAGEVVAKRPQPARWW